MNQKALFKNAQFLHSKFSVCPVISYKVSYYVSGKIFFFKDQLVRNKQPFIKTILFFCLYPKQRLLKTFEIKGIFLAFRIDQRNNKFN